MAFTAYDHLPALAMLGKGIDKFQQRQTLSSLGQGIDGSPEGFAKAGQSLLALGDVGGATNMFALSEKARERSLTEGLTKSSPFNATGGGGMGTPRSPVAPALSALGQPRVVPPKQGVHVAETEEDVQRLERATGMVTTDADRQAIVKTVYGEAANEPAVGQQAVAAVIRNRANQAGLTPEQITQQRNQFEPWNTEAGRARMNGIGQQRFDQIAGTVAPVIDQGLDPTGGATHFYAPRAQAALGRNAPSWDDGSGNDIGNHRFFQHGYGQGGGTPAPAPQTIIASAPQGAPVQMAQAPAEPGAPGQPIGFGSMTTEQLSGYLNDPSVPPNVKAMMQGELQKRQGIPSAPQQPEAPVQVAQAPAEPQQPGNPVADMPAQAGSPVQDQPGGFRVPQTLPPNDLAPNVSTQEAMAIALNPKHPHRAFAAELVKSRQAYASETAPEKREQVRLETQKKGLEIQKLEREVSGVLTPEQEAQKIRLAKAGRTVNEAALPPGYRAVRDREGNLERIEPIPGSKAEAEVKQLAEKKAKADVLRAETGSVVANALDDIDRLAGSSSLPVAGAIGSRISGIPGTAAHDVAKSLETVGANISFGQLQQMRESSPTGGALGAVTERELDLLKNSFASLSQTQSPEQFKTNLGRVRATFERIVHGRTLSPQERKTGGPMTLERAKGLREQAQQAIASGAPREGVLKRLKEDYGITPEGL